MGQKFVIPYSNGSVYEGNCNEAARPDGQGKLKLNNGNIFAGLFDNGTAKSGKATYYVDSTEYASYDGQLVDGMFQGEGLLKFKTGQHLSGKFYRGQLIFGSIHFRNGDQYNGNNTSAHQIEGEGRFSIGNDVYEGTFQEGQLNGQCSVQFKNKDEFRGQMSNGVVWGHGIYKQFKGFRYNGQFKRGMFNDRGEISYSDGSHYDGGFEDNRRQGFGEYVFPDDTKYIGQFSKDMMLGWCEIRFAGGPIQLYRGQICNGVLQGLGQIIYRNGSIYQGELEDNVPHGQGYTKYASGTTYDGHFSHGRYSGSGHIVFHNGDSYQGQFQNGKFSGSGKYTNVNAGKTYEGLWFEGLKHGLGRQRDTNNRIESGNWFMGLKNGHFTLELPSGRTEQRKYEAGRREPSYAC